MLGLLPERGATTMPLWRNVLACRVPVARPWSVASRSRGVDPSRARLVLLRRGRPAAMASAQQPSQAPDNPDCRFTPENRAPLAPPWRHRFPIPAGNDFDAGGEARHAPRGLPPAAARSSAPQRDRLARVQSDGTLAFHLIGLPRPKAYFRPAGKSAGRNMPSSAGGFQSDGNASVPSDWNPANRQRWAPLLPRRRRGSRGAR